MLKKNKTPQLRFRGFEGEWNLNRLENLASFAKGQGYSKSDLAEEGSPILLYGKLYTNYETVINDVDTKAKEKKGSVYSQGNEVVIPSSGETSEDIARASAIIKKGIIIGGDLNVIIPKNSIDSIFLALNISNGTAQSELIKRAQGKSVVHIRNTDLKEIILSYPEKLEQSKISTYFQHLDNLINLHQKKYEKLVILKKAMLSKMFPKNNAKVPEIRFSGFSDSWVKHSLNQVCDFSRGVGYNRNDVAFEGKYECILYGHLYTTYGMVISEVKYYTNLLSEKSVLSKVGDVLIPSSDTTPTGLARATSLEKSDVILGGDINIIRPNKSLNGNFLSYNINSNRDKLLKLIKGTTVRHLDNTELKTVELFIANDINEQIKIANFFRKTDDLISNQKTELEKLKNIKKACLEKMFV